MSVFRWISHIAFVAQAFIPCPKDPFWVPVLLRTSFQKQSAWIINKSLLSCSLKSGHEQDVIYWSVLKNTDKWSKKKKGFASSLTQQQAPLYGGSWAGISYLWFTAEI